ncbi:hypothetical protein, partial [uncultured Bilophila sp.]|uniref:hypothetical protein n=1 Tax=uncultured Bilophila sp. TaxID=529385 RepID=UPI0026DB0631
EREPFFRKVPSPLPRFFFRHEMKKARIAPGLFHERKNMFVYGMASQQDCCEPYTGMLYIYGKTFPQRKRVERKALAPAFRRTRAKIYGAGDGI